VRAVPPSVAAFLESTHLAVAGVARDGRLPANAIYRRLRDAGYDVVPVNPATDRVEGVACYPSVIQAPHPIDGVVIATPPSASERVVQDCLAAGVQRVWMHRSFGDGSVSESAVRACRRAGIDCIVGGCPLMFCEPVDVGHRCMRWWLQRRGRVPTC
jgi:predicted CoA-binding protein